MMSSDEEDSDCPLCMEELDIADRNFRPCPCGYQICRFCWHHIKTNLNGRCPACRRLYSDQIVEFVPVSAEEIMRLKKEKKEKDRQTREMKDPSRRQLSNVRVVQKNLVYVLGLSSKYASVENEFFKKYGRIDKVVISKRTAPSGSSSSVGIYVTYIRKEDASRAIEGMNGIEVDGKTIRASYGTTKYCTYYLRHMACPNPNCMYLHEPGDDIDSYNKDTIPIGKHATSTSTTTSGYPNKRPATATKVAPSTTPTSSSNTPEPKPTTTPRTWAPIPKVVPISPVVVADKEETSTNTETNSPSLSKENIKPSTSSKITKPIASVSSSTSANKPTSSAKLTRKPSGIIDKSHTPKKAPVVIEEDEKPALPASASWATAQPVLNVGNTMTPANFGPSLSDALNAPQKPKHSPSLKVKKEKKIKNKMVRLEEFEEAEREAKLAATKSKLGGVPSAAAIVAGVAKPQQHIETKPPLSEESVPEDKHSEQDIVMDDVSMEKEPKVSEVTPEENVDVSGIQNTNVDEENKVTKDTEPVDIVPDEEDAKNDTFEEDSAIDSEITKSESVESIKNEDIKVPEIIDNAPNMSNDNKLELHEAVDNTLEDNDQPVQQESIANEDVNQDTLDTTVDDDKLAALNDTVVKAFDEAAAAAADATSEKVEATEQPEQLDEHVDEYETKEEQFVQNISSPLAAMDRLSALVQQEIMSDSPKQPPFDLSQQEELQRQQPIQQQQQQQQPLPPNMNRFDMGMPMQESFENRQPPIPPPGLGGPPPPPPGWMNRGFDPFNGQDPSIIAARRLQHSQRMLEASGLFGGHPPVVPRFGFSPDFNRGSNGFLPQQPPPMGMFPPPPHHPPHPPHPLMRHPPPPELMNMQPPFGPPLHMQPPQQHVQQVEMQNDMPRSQPQQQLMDNLRNDFNTMKINGNEHQQSRDDLRALLPNVNISFNNLEEKRRAEEFYQQQLLMQRQQQQQHMLQQQQQMHHQALQQQRMQEQEQIPNLRRPELAGFSSPPMQPPQESMLMKSPMNQQWQQPQQQEPQQQNGGEDKRNNPDVREAQNFFGEFLRKAASNQQEGSPQKEEPPAQQNHSLPFQDPAIMSVRVENNNENNELLNSQNTILRILGGQAPPPPSGMMTLEQQQQMHQQRQMDARFMMDQHQRMMHQNDMGPNGMFMRPPPPPNFAQQQQQQQSPQQQQQFHQQGFFREPPMGMMGRMPPPPPGMMRPPMPPLNDMRFRNMGNGQPFPPPPPPGMFSNEENRQ